jgi:hypothetical protein
VLSANPRSLPKYSANPGTVDSNGNGRRRRLRITGSLQASCSSCRTPHSASIVCLRIATSCEGTDAGNQRQRHALRQESAVSFRWDKADISVLRNTVSPPSRSLTSRVINASSTESASAVAFSTFPKTPRRSIRRPRVRQFRIKVSTPLRCTPDLIMTLICAWDIASRRTPILRSSLPPTTLATTHTRQPGSRSNSLSVACRRILTCTPDQFPTGKEVRRSESSKGEPKNGRVTVPLFAL